MAAKKAMVHRRRFLKIYSLKFWDIWQNFTFIVFYIMSNLKWKLNDEFCNIFNNYSNERILCKLSKSEILRLYSFVHVAMKTTKTSNFTCQSKSFISIVFTCQVSACELQPFSCHDLANDIYQQTAKTVFNHLNIPSEERWFHVVIQK